MGSMKYFMIGIGIMVVLALIAYMQGSLAGNWTNIAQEIAPLFIALIAFGVGLAILVNRR